jgi:hypothetical protein
MQIVNYYQYKGIKIAMKMDFNGLYEEYGISQKKREHMAFVAKISLMIADMLKIPVDKELLYNAAMLHDIGFNGYDLMTDFDHLFLHQVKTRERIEKLGYPLLAKTASNHNFFGITKKESIEWGYTKGISLVPRSIESKIIAFADSFRPHLVTKRDCWTIKKSSSHDILLRHKMLKKAINRKKRAYDFLVKNGMDYESLYDEFINA